MTELSRGNRDHASLQLRKKPCTSPVPNLAVVTYFLRTPCQRRKHIERSASWIAMMVNHNSVTSIPQPTELKRASLSSIPRPSSGTSRVSITSTIPTKSCMRVEPMVLAHERQTTVQRRPYVVQDEDSVQGYHLPGPLLPSSELLLGKCLPNVIDRDEAHTKKKLVKSLTSSSLGPPSGYLYAEKGTRKARSSPPRFATQADLVYSRERSSSNPHQKKGEGFELDSTYQTRRSSLVPDFNLSLPGSIRSVVGPKHPRSGPAAQQLPKAEATEEGFDPRLVSFCCQA